MAQHPEKPPRRPAALGKAGRAVWADAWSLRWMHGSDRAAIEHLCRLEDERAELVAAIVASGGPLLTEPIVTPKGDIAGERHYANPLLAEVHRRDQTIDRLRASLGLTPMARARLGMVVLEAEIRRDAQERIMAKYRDAAGSPQRTRRSS